MDDKAFDLVAFNRSAERSFLNLVSEFCRSAPQPVGAVLADCAYALDVSTETVKRYLAKYSSRFGPLSVERGMVSLRGSSYTDKQEVSTASPCVSPPPSVSSVSAGFALAALEDSPADHSAGRGSVPVEAGPVAFSPSSVPASGEDCAGGGGLGERDSVPVEAGPGAFSPGSCSAARGVSSPVDRPGGRDSVPVEAGPGAFSPSSVPARGAGCADRREVFRAEEAGAVSCEGAPPGCGRNGCQAEDSPSVRPPMVLISADSDFSLFPFGLSDVRRLLDAERVSSVRGFRLSTSEAVARYVVPFVSAEERDGGELSLPGGDRPRALRLFPADGEDRGGSGGKLGRASFEVDWSEFLTPDGKRRSRPRTDVCECGHHFRFHDNEAGSCDVRGCGCELFRSRPR